MREEATFETGAPRILFQAPGFVNVGQTEYCVSADGKRFIFGEPLPIWVAETPLLQLRIRRVISDNEVVCEAI